MLVYGEALVADSETRTWALTAVSSVNMTICVTLFVVLEISHEALFTCMFQNQFVSYLARQRLNF